MTEDPIDKLEQMVWEKFKGLGGIVVRDFSGASSEGRKMAELAPILTHFSIKRQEKILTQQEKVLRSMKKQSDSMAWQSKAMLILTGVIIVFMVAQITLTVIQLCKS